MHGQCLLQPRHVLRRSVDTFAQATESVLQVLDSRVELRDECSGGLCLRRALHLIEGRAGNERLHSPYASVRQIDP